MWSRTLAVRAFRRSHSRLNVVLVGVAGAASALAEAASRDEDRSSNSCRDSHRHSQRTTLCETATVAPSEPLSLLRARQTLRRLDQESRPDDIEDRYSIDWKHPLGEGSFGVVYRAVCKQDGSQVAVKVIHNTPHEEPELRALLHLRQYDSHPHICWWHETYRSNNNDSISKNCKKKSTTSSSKGNNNNSTYVLVLDLVEGGELFDHLVNHGAYSEADAARLVREVASALAFLHGLGVVHGDLKPENIMLSSKNASDAVIKLIDFGCAVVLGDENPEQSTGLVGRTLAYCPPELLDKKQPKVQAGADMWALGVLLYIMLTGVHPFDLTGQADDAEVARDILQTKVLPIRNSIMTAHLSESAIDLMERLMDRNPDTRLTAEQMLAHPWTRGVTARRSKMVDAHWKLSQYEKSDIAHRVFANAVAWSDDDVSRRASLIERAFREFDQHDRGYLTREDLEAQLESGIEQKEHQQVPENEEPVLDLSGFADLLAENMKNKYFPKGTVLYKEGDIGNHMYFINSGTVSVETGGSSVKRGPGDFFGEGALLHSKRVRSATIRCDTPVHAMEISRRYFENYIAKRSDSELMLTLLEKDKIRKRNRVKMILRLQNNLKKREFRDGELVFAKGDTGDSMFLVEKGNVEVNENEKHVFTATPGNVFGEYSLLTGRPRNCTAVCRSDTCIVQQLFGRDFHKLTLQSPEIILSLRELCLRRDFKKAVVNRLKQEFPYQNPRQAFDAVKKGDDDTLTFKAVETLMRELYSGYTREELEEIFETLDLTSSGSISFEEFKKVFVADKKKSESI